MVSKEDKEHINSLINKMRDEGNKRMVSFWGAVKGKKSYICHSNQACHAGLNMKNGWNHDANKLLSPDFIVSRIQWENNERPLKTEVVDAYLKWLTTYSPYAKAFVYKGGPAMRKRGFVVTRTDIPSNLMAGALFASRAITEHSGQIALIWYLLKEEGVNPDVAFCYAHQVSSPDHERVDVGGTHCSGWHVAWNGDAPNQTIQNFLDRKYIIPNGNYKDKNGYSNVQALWGNTSGGRNSHRQLISIAMKAVEDGGMVKKNINPFKAANLGQKVTPLIPFIKVWASLINNGWKKEEEVVEEFENAA